LLRFTRPVQSEDFHKIEFLCEPLTANDVEIPYCNSTITIGELRRRVRDLGPWHHEIEILPGISTKTAISLDACTAAFNWWMGPLLRAMYPSGLTERSFLDVGCNGGGYSWVASRCGAGEIYGFDARGKWIEQAVFLKGLYPNWQKVEFVTHTLDEFYLKEKRKFSVVNYAGLLYHVFDPIESLKLLSERAEEVLFVESATKSELHSGELVPDGAFVMHDVGVEGPNHQLCGLERIEWYPSGPEVIKRVLIHLGFESAETVFWRRYVHGGKHPIGRMCVVGVRNKKMLATKAVILCLEHLNSFNRTFATPKNVIEEVNRDH
jgi:2-polyprenyl-3-methyl-5-hydroxy-6-metoxy-1,4-benzoquinol methylase